MNISNVSPNTVQGNQQKPANQGMNTKLGKDAFLQLLVAQMKNQDPTHPMDGSKLATQLAQFNTVEQLIDLNGEMNKLVKSQQNMSTSISNTMAASLAGKKIRAVSDRIHLQAGKDCTIPYQLSGPADKVTITITDSNGTEVRSIQLEHVSKGNHTWTWNGETENGNNVPEGIYVAHVNAQNGDDKVGSLTYQKGVVQKVRYTPNGVRLMINGVAIPLGNVKEIGV